MTELDIETFTGGLLLTFVAMAEYNQTFGPGVSLPGGQIREQKFWEFRCPSFGRPHVPPGLIRGRPEFLGIFPRTAEASPEFGVFEPVGPVVESAFAMTQTRPTLASTGE